MKKSFIVLLALVLIVGIAVGGTVAWLTATSETVVNTFTVGDINITLTETTTNYKIVPGLDIAKDPKVTVTANSETCYVFVKVTEANWPSVTETDGTTRKVNYAIADGWTQLEDADKKPVPGVYYREVATSDSVQNFPVLKDNKVTVSGSLTKAEVNAITPNPTLTFTAYASQLYKSAGVEFSAKEAWNNVNPTT